MKIELKPGDTGVRSYNEEDKLNPNSFYRDHDGALVITDRDGHPACCISTDEVGSPYFITWPLQDTHITSVTVSL